MNSYIKIEKAGFATIQDSGRYLLGHFGYSVEGALDQFAYKMGNAILGNDLNEPSIEIMQSEFSMTSSVDVSICITGSPSAVKVNEEERFKWETILLKPNDKLKISSINGGTRVYIAIAGGLEVSYIHGSASYDGNINIGKKLQNNELVHLKSEPKNIIRLENKIEKKLIPEYNNRWTLRFCEGPESHIFKEHLEPFQLVDFRVSTENNNVGVRLEKFRLIKYKPLQTLSKGVVPGAIEITSSGQPIILNKGRGGTIGYPVIGCVAAVDLDKVGQLKPHDSVRFKFISFNEAIKDYKKKQNLIDTVYKNSKIINGL